MSDSLRFILPPSNLKPLIIPSYRMANDCLNCITIYADAETIRLIVDAGYELLNLVPPLEDESMFRKEYGSSRFYHYKMKKIGKEAVLFSFCSAWVPPYGYFEKLVKHQKGITFMKVDWDIAMDGYAGVWVAQRDNEGDLDIKSIDWNEGFYQERLERFGEL